MLNKFCVDASKNSVLEYIQNLLCLGEFDMNKKKSTVFGLICCLFVMCLVVVGCDNLLNDKKNDETGIDYESYSDYALIVKNNAQKNMVLFKGEPSANQLLGGVRAGSTTKLKNNTSIFSESTDYVVYVVTEENYNAYKDNLKALNNSPYCTFYAVYNKGMVNENTYQISNMLNGAYSITVNNGSNYNVEFRNNGSEGESIAFIMNNTYEQKYYLEQGNYMLFPVFRKYDKHSGEILSSYPIYPETAAVEEIRNKPKFFSFSLDNDTTERQFNVKDWVKDIEFKPSAAYIEINNFADQGLLFFTSADSVPLITSSGGKYINTGKSLIFPIEMRQNDENNYEESKTVSGYRLGTNAFDFYLLGDKNKEETYKAGFLYSYTVTGDPVKGYVIKPTTEKVEKEDGTIVEVLKAQPYGWSTLD